VGRLGHGALGPTDGEVWLAGTRCFAGPKPRPNHERQLAILRSMTPEQRLLKACELSDLSKALFWEGMRHRNPGLPEEELRRKGVRQLWAWQGVSLAELG
jgi:hypothetical protein